MVSFPGKLGPQVSDIKNLFRPQKGNYEFSRFDNADKKIREETRMKRQCDYLMEKGTKFDRAGYYYNSASRVTVVPGATRAPASGDCRTIPGEPS